MHILPFSTGKTCLLNQFNNTRFSSLYKTTIGTDFCTKDVILENRPVSLQVGTCAWIKDRSISTSACHCLYLSCRYGIHLVMQHFKFWACPSSVMQMAVYWCLTPQMPRHLRHWTTGGMNSLFLLAQGLQKHSHSWLWAAK